MKENIPEPGTCRHCDNLLTEKDYIGIIQAAMGKAYAFKCPKCEETNIDYVRGNNENKVC
jgi:phage FluMu protein Com